MLFFLSPSFNAPGGEAVGRDDSESAGPRVVPLSSTFKTLLEPERTSRFHLLSFGVEVPEPGCEREVAIGGVLEEGRGDEVELVTGDDEGEVG